MDESINQPVVDLTPSIGNDLQVMFDKITSGNNKTVDANMSYSDATKSIPKTSLNIDNLLYNVAERDQRISFEIPMGTDVND